MKKTYIIVLRNRTYLEISCKYMKQNTFGVFEFYDKKYFIFKRLKAIAPENSLIYIK